MTRCVLLALALAGVLSAAPKTKTVILVTADGLRWQEVFSGVDAAIEQKPAARIPGSRREQLLPFFWTELAKNGVLFRGRVTNGMRVSYPGYSEMLTGRAQDDKVTGNDPIANPTPTVLEVVRERLKLSPDQVALFGSWATLNHIGEHTPGSVTINAGYEAYGAPGASPRLQELSRLQFDILTGWAEVRHDYITFEMALEYLRTEKPRLLHIALGETDDWAHGKNYTRYLETAHYFDACLRRLWDSVDRSNTTLMVTTDHGRGDDPATWDGHGKKIPAADRIWVAMIGPDTPARGVSEREVLQRDVAPTILDLFGIDHKTYPGVLGSPIKP